MFEHIQVVHIETSQIARLDAKASCESSLAGCNIRWWCPCGEPSSTKRPWCCNWTSHMFLTFVPVDVDPCRMCFRYSKSLSLLSAAGAPRFPSVRQIRVQFATAFGQAELPNCIGRIWKSVSRDVEARYLQIATSLAISAKSVCRVVQTTFQLFLATRPLLGLHMRDNINLLTPWNKTAIGAISHSMQQYQTPCY